MTLPSGVSCTLDKDCQSLVCCLEVKKLQMALSFGLTLDVCEMKFAANIEEMTFQKSLFDFPFNTEQSMDLFGMFNMKLVYKNIISIILK